MLSEEQNELLNEYQEHLQNRENELTLVVYIPAFEDVLRIIRNVSFLPIISE